MLDRVVVQGPNWNELQVLGRSTMPGKFHIVADVSVAQPEILAMISSIWRQNATHMGTHPDTNERHSNLLQRSAFVDRSFVNETIGSSVCNAAVVSSVLLRLNVGLLLNSAVNFQSPRMGRIPTLATRAANASSAAHQPRTAFLTNIILNDDASTPVAAEMK